MNEALRMRVKAEEMAERYRDAGIKINENSMWHNPWTGAAEYDVNNYGPSYWVCEDCGVRVYEGGDDVCEECGLTYEEMEAREEEITDERTN
jgi:rubrerythrin